VTIASKPKPKIKAFWTIKGIAEHLDVSDEAQGFCGVERKSKKIHISSELALGMFCFFGFSSSLSGRSR